MRPSIDLQGQRSRAVVRRTLRDRGPDTGREVDHLKLRSRNSADDLLDLYEGGGGGDPDDLTQTDGTVLFMYGVSGYGADGYGS